MRFQIRIYDRTGVLIRVLQNEEVIACNFSIVLNDVGVLALSLPMDTTRYPLSMFALDTFLEVWLEKSIDADPIQLATYLVREYTIFREKGKTGEYLRIGALHVNYWLHKSIINPNDDPVAADSFVTRAGDAVQVMHDYAYYQIGPGASVHRSVPGLTLTMVGTGQYVVGRYRYDDTLFDVFEQLSYRGQSDFYIQRTTANNFELVIGRQGSDKTYTTNYPVTPAVVFSPLRGNLINPELEVDRRDEYTYFYGMGEGTNAGQDIYLYPTPARFDSPYNRRETTVDAANGDSTSTTIQHLITETVLEANKKAAKQTLKFEIPSTQIEREYKTLWDIGDDVTISYNGVVIDMRVQQIEFKFDGRNPAKADVIIKERRVE